VVEEEDMVIEDMVVVVAIDMVAVAVEADIVVVVEADMVVVGEDTENKIRESRRQFVSSSFTHPSFLTCIQQSFW
jgi:hypothetical protein